MFGSKRQSGMRWTPWRGNCMARPEPSLWNAKGPGIRVGGQAPLALDLRKPAKGIAGSQGDARESERGGEKDTWSGNERASRPDCSERDEGARSGAER